jgi:meiotically up-regulated gene 157 (Mug157) protein
LFEDRLFVSPTVEAVIEDVSSRIADDTIRQIFRNTLPSTLDTTVLWHRPRGKYPIPYTYIITGGEISIHLAQLKKVTIIFHLMYV